ncbi:hypothetical protein [Halorubellus sp. PRR65]|uniref:hypothetical protein n=1 Tax=Halorubellus sp. PRR65 TaxID=3098148 RepID=UPI002B25E253|nr:hypothetical protein [Halorubellus sp. PRR65]
MDGRRLAVVLVLVSLPLFAFAVTYQPADERVHRTSVRQGQPGVDAPTPYFEDVADARAQNFTVRYYENLTERGQELYVNALENAGTYAVPVGEGASDYAYPSDAELPESDAAALRASTVVVVRPENASLPSADEGSPDVRLDMMQTQTASPPLSSSAYLPNYLAALAGVVALAVAGHRYRRESLAEPDVSVDGPF